MGLAVYPRASFAWGVEGSFACACTANVPEAACGAGWHLPLAAV